MSDKLSRREFLKLSGLALTSLAFTPDFPQDQTPESLTTLGRVSYESISVFDTPTLNANTVDFRFRDEILNIYQTVQPSTGPVYNPYWYRIWGGYVHSAHIQPVNIRFSLPQENISPNGVLSKLTVPYSTPFNYSRANGWTPTQDFRLYYDSTHWVTDIVEGPDQKAWYQISDELWDGFIYYIPAPHLAPISFSELTPISPDIPSEDKTIEVNLTTQTLSAFEGDKIIFQSKVSTGVNTNVPSGSLPTTTPTGTHYIYSKMPSKHMGIGRLTDNLGDRALPGVPFTSFFAEGGYAIHGSYWHNNYGAPMSRGCINMRPKDAQWVFRWITPTWNPEISDQTDWEVRGRGTKLIIET